MASILFPADPVEATPGVMTPGDPGGTSISPGGGGTSGLNQWSATVGNDPGLCLVNVANVAGRALVAYIGWNDWTFPNLANVSVADDAHNYWQPLVANAETGAHVRGAIWIAANAQPATVVSVSATLPLTAMAVSVVEFPAFPALVQEDFTPQTSASIFNSGTLSAAATTGDWVFGLAVTGDNLDTVTAPGTPWTTLNTVSINDPSGAGGISDLMISPIYGSVSAGSVSMTFTASASLPLALSMASITQASPTVVNTGNPNWPVFTVELGFGAQPGSGTSTFTWTDVTSRAYFGEGDNIIDATRGRAYELTSPESGTIEVWLSNTDGALTPGNTASPYYPNIKPETPIRILATWNNVVYPVAYGYVDKWPQSFDMPQWPMTNVAASDAMGVLANLTLYSCLQATVLLDNPYAYWPLGESYGEANGLPFDNLGAGDPSGAPQPMIGYDGQSSNSAPLSTGLSLNLQGDQGSGIGMSGLTTNPALWGSGAICIDPALANNLGSTITIEFWASLDTTPPSGGSFVIPLVSLLGSPTNFGSGGGPVRMQVSVKSTSGNIYDTQFTLADFNGNSFTSSAFSYANDGNLHHHVFVVEFSGGTWDISHYLDGGFDTTVTNSTVGQNIDYNSVVIGPALITPLTSNPYNYTIAHVAIYNTSLALARIQDHHNAGVNGFQLETALMRFKRIMAWSQTHLPMAATNPSAAPLMGAAFAVEGQAATDAFNDLLVSEGGWPYADAAGNTWWASRASFYNRSAKWVFGDNPANGETPYAPTQSFDFDNAYLYTQVQGSRQVGQSTVDTTSSKGVLSQVFQDTGAIARVSSKTAGLAYGNRNALQQSIVTSSDQDVYDRAHWSLQKYSQSSFRVPQITIDAASNPALWPVVLGVEQGDIVQVNRRPLGAAAYTMTGIVVQVHLEIGPNKGQVTLGIVPYNIEATIAQVDNPPFNTLANGIGW